MTVVSRLRTVRAILATGVAARALGWGVAAALTLVIGAALVDQHAALGVGTRHLVLGIAIATLLVTAAVLAWRDRTVTSLERVALWVEEQHPSLEYTLVTAIETGDERFVSEGGNERWPATARRRAAAAAVAPIAALIVAAIVVMLLPSGAVARIRSPHAGDALDLPTRAVARRASRLTPLVAQIESPAYSGQRSQTIDEPSDLKALVGSVVTLRGRGDARGIVARAGTDSVAAVARGDRWSITWRVTAKPVAIRLTDMTVQPRIVAIEPIVDNPPAVTLVTPAHDSVLRAPKGRIPLTADVNDDYGVATASFELIVSSGEGETFSFKSGTLGEAHPKARHASITASLSIDSLGLKPGDIVHLRAIARDANDASGPGFGTSETRAIRIARADEYDSVSVDAAPPTDADKSVISERMLILLAEALQKKRPSLKREMLVSESRAIGSDQKKLRRTVGEIVFTRLGGEPSGEEHTDEDSPSRAKTLEELLARADSATNVSSNPLDFEGGESPVVAVNKPLLEAYNAMWDATTELEVGEPGKALPHMRRALAAIEQARVAERLYLRGRPPQVVIDLSKARLKGKDKGFTSKRRALSATDSATQARADRFVRIVELTARDARAAADSLLVLRIDALTDNPTFAAALSDAASAIRAGKGDIATTALARARRSLAGVPAARDSIARWGIVP